MAQFGSFAFCLSYEKNRRLPLEGQAASHVIPYSIFSALGRRQIRQELGASARDITVGTLASGHGRKTALLDGCAAAPRAFALQRGELGGSPFLLLEAVGAYGRERGHLGGGCGFRLHSACGATHDRLTRPLKERRPHERRTCQQSPDMFLSDRILHRSLLLYEPKGSFLW